MKHDKDNPQWTDKDFQRAKGEEALPSSLRRKLRGPQRAPTKVPVSIRLSHEVVEHFKASGPGWQSRMDTALKTWIRRDKKKKAA